MSEAQVQNEPKVVGVDSGDQGSAQSAADKNDTSGVVDPGLARAEPLEDSSAGAPGDGASPPAAGDAKPDWRDARIARLTAQRREAETRAQSAETALAQARAGGASAGLDEAEFARRVEVEATRRAAAKAFNDSCNEVHQSGVKTYTDFNSAIERLTRLVDKEDQESLVAYNQFLQAAIDTGRAEHVLYALGNDLNEAQRLLALRGSKLGVELAKVAYAVPGGLQVSSAPKPLRPVASRGASHEAIQASDPERADTLAIDTWMARREAEIAAKSKDTVH